jgi:S-adenosylmethionine-diacylgycerolhomoserine-N-methlytransferase
MMLPPGKLLPPYAGTGENAAEGEDIPDKYSIAAVELSPPDVGARIAGAGGRWYSDAAIVTYALSLMPRWQDAWSNLLDLCRPGARIGVVDMQDPTGAAAVFTPLARFACRLGGADITARPWQAVERDCLAASVRGGHVQIRAGRVSIRGGRA